MSSANAGSERHGNYPNPFNPTTTIRFGLPETSDVRLEVFDMLGRHVRVLVDGSLEAGYHSVSFDAGLLSSGTYVFRLRADVGVLVGVMHLFRSAHHFGGHRADGPLDSS